MPQNSARNVLKRLSKWTITIAFEMVVAISETVSIEYNKPNMIEMIEKWKRILKLSQHIFYYNKKFCNPEIVFIQLFIRSYCFECYKYYDRVKMPSFVQLKNIDELFHTHPFFPTTYNKYDESDDESDDDWL